MSAHPKSIKRDFSQFDVGIGLVNIKSLVVALPPTVPPPMEIVRVRVVMTESVGGSGVQLTSGSSTAYEHFALQ